MPGALLAIHHAELSPATAEPSLVAIGQQASYVASPSAAGAEGSGPAEGGAISLKTFRSLLDKLMQQKADIESLLPAADVDIVRINAAALKRALIPWPVNRLSQLHKAMPVLAAGEMSPEQQFCITSCTTVVTVSCMQATAHVQWLPLQRFSMQCSGARQPALC